jgi:hypothetical protein
VGSLVYRDLFSAAVNAARCSSYSLGFSIVTNSYTFRSSVLVDTKTTGALILNPIACGLAGLVMILAPIAALVSGRVVHGVSTVRGLPGATID